MKPLKNRKATVLHRRIKSLLIELYPGFRILEEQRIQVEVNGRKTDLFVDLVVTELMLAIECHGRQHFDYVPHFHGSRAGHTSSQYRDQEKARYLAEIGYSYLMISHEEEQTITASQLLERMTQAIEE